MLLMLSPVTVEKRGSKRMAMLASNLRQLDGNVTLGQLSHHRLLYIEALKSSNNSIRLVLKLLRKCLGQILESAVQAQRPGFAFLFEMGAIRTSKNGSNKASLSKQLGTVNIL